MDEKHSEARKQGNGYAEVVSISDSIPWNAHACLGDALNRAAIDADLMVVWIDKDGKLSWAKSCQRNQAVYMLNAAIWKMTFE